MALPTDPIMLLSVVNLKLQDKSDKLVALCVVLVADGTQLCTQISLVGVQILSLIHIS